MFASRRSCSKDKAWTCTLQVEKLYHSLFDEKPNKPILELDSAAAVKFTKADEITARCKHIDLRYCRVREAYEKGLCEVNWIPRAENAEADGFTHALGKCDHAKFLAALGFVEVEEDLVKGLQGSTKTTGK